MNELKKGQVIPLTDGKSVTVIKELGRGGQGIVYLVELSGKEMALKWYLRPMDDDKFYSNLQKNVDFWQNHPDDDLFKSFIWPKYLTKKLPGNYCGYVMDLRPQGYYEMGEFCLAIRKFGSWEALLAAAMKICLAFQRLHLNGLSYQDLNDGNFFINPQTGDVWICDNDNVMPNKAESGIKGKARYMAPEVFLGKSKPDKFSDRFSLAVILFMLLYGNHPLEGKRALELACMTEKNEKILYGEEPVFIMDPGNEINRPVPYKHKNVLRRWPLYPEALKQTFIKQFSKDVMENPQKRCLETEWRNLLASVRDSIVKCPHCGKATFANVGSTASKCMECGKEFTLSGKIHLAGDRILPLTPGTQHYLDFDNSPDIKVLKNPKDNSIVLQNTTDKAWNVQTASGKVVNVEPRGYMPAKPGLKINFYDGMKGEVK